MCSSYEKQDRNLLSPWCHWAPFVRPLKGLGIKIDVWENPLVYASTRDWSSLYGAIRSEPETATQSSYSHFHFWVSLGTLTLSLFCMHRSGCSYWDASGEFCLPSLRVLSFAWALKKKSQCRRTTVSSSKRTFANPSKFLWTLRSTDWKWTAVDRRRGITAAEGHGASKSTGWPRQRCTKTPSLPGSDRWLSKKKQKKIRSLFLHILVQSSYILDVVGTFWIWSSTNMPQSLLQCWARHAPLTLFDCVTCAIYSRSLYATSQWHDLCCDSDVMEKPSRRWRGAVQQLADFVWES